jgi:site-specific recombinase XerD
MLALTNMQLVEGQKTRVLRHTFASHFMMNGGNILVLQRIWVMRISEKRCVTLTLRQNIWKRPHC